jgi:peptide/nickel transport system ATP-binding protein
MLSRILLIHPRLIVADEPISMIDVSLRASFLNQLQSFKKNLGISCLYITHDLNNASYASDRMIVLCRARIVEEGPTAEVIKNPLHPYTQLLIESIPVPDPDKRWKDKTDLAKSKSHYDEISSESGCVFSNRCPHVKNVCQQKSPELIEVSSKRKIACLHK